MGEGVVIGRPDDGVGCSQVESIVCGSLTFEPNKITHYTSLGETTEV